MTRPLYCAQAPLRGVLRTRVPPLISRDKAGQQHHLGDIILETREGRAPRRGGIPGGAAGQGHPTTDCRAVPRTPGDRRRMADLSHHVGGGPSASGAAAPGSKMCESRTAPKSNSGNNCRRLLMTTFCTFP